jgi:DNA-binding response OmpR family regulator
MMTFESLGKTGLDIGHAARVLVLDDDPVALDLALTYLDDRGLRGIAASGPQDFARDLDESMPDLVVLDLHPNAPAGLDLLRDLRARSDVPVIVTTADGRAEPDRVAALELGADDYMTKPYGLRELLARIRAVLRRQAAGQVPRPRDPERGRYRFAGWQLDRRTRSLTDRSGAPVTLTKSEYALLAAFIDAPQRPLSRFDLMQATRLHEDVFDRAIDVQVLRLRRKLEPAPSAPQVIRTERGVGYTFVPAVERV